MTKEHKYYNEKDKTTSVDTTYSYLSLTKSQKIIVVYVN